MHIFLQVATRELERHEMWKRSPRSAAAGRYEKHPYGFSSRTFCIHGLAGWEKSWQGACVTSNRPIWKLLTVSVYWYWASPLASGRTENKKPLQSEYPCEVVVRFELTACVRIGPIKLYRASHSTLQSRRGRWLDSFFKGEKPPFHIHGRWTQLVTITALLMLPARLLKHQERKKERGLMSSH